MCVNLCNQGLKKHYLEKENIDISFVSTHAKCVCNMSLLRNTDKN